MEGSPLLQQVKVIVNGRLKVYRHQIGPEQNYTSGKLEHLSITIYLRLHSYENDMNMTNMIQIVLNTFIGVPKLFGVRMPAKK